ncbi:Tol-Pal system protein TolB [Streptomyces griseomycini]
MEFDAAGRRVLPGASAAGPTAAASPAGARTAAAPPAPTAAGEHVLEYREMTGGSVTASGDGRVLVAEVQGVLWRVPRGGGAAVRLTDWELEATGPALSPDGATVALCGYRGGAFRLWAMRIDGGGLRRLTDGPWDDRGAAWSPDGTRLVFSSERGGDAVAGSAFGLWTLDVRDGHVRKLTGGDFEDLDAAWWPDGRSVVCVRAAHTPDGASDGGRSLVRVPAAGGAARTVRTVAEGRLLCPSVSPSGRIAYLRLSGTGDSPSLPAAAAVLMVDGQVVAADEDLAAAPPCWLGEDRLLYVADGRIRVRTLGTPSVEEIPFTARMPVPRPHWRPKARAWNPAGPVPVRGIHLPALSPDGRSVAFAALNALWLMDVGGTPRKLVQASGVHHLQTPAWAPDGRSLLYCTDQGGLTAVRRLHLDGGRDEPITGQGRLCPAPSPDGSLLACQDVAGNLLLRTLATGAERVLARPMATDGPPGAPTWSPDGRYVAFCDRNRLNHRFREGYHLIRVLDTRTGTERRHLPAAHQSLSDRAAAGPVWSPDGRWMALVAESALCLLPVTTDGTPAGPVRRLTDEPADHPSWAGDANTLLYLSSGRLRLMTLDAGRAPARTRTLPVPLTVRRRPSHDREPLRIHAGQLWDATGTAPRQDVAPSSSTPTDRGSATTCAPPPPTGTSRASSPPATRPPCTPTPPVRRRSAGHSPQPSAPLPAPADRRHRAPARHTGGVPCRFPRGRTGPGARTSSASGPPGPRGRRAAAPFAGNAPGPVPGRPGGPLLPGDQRDPEAVSRAVAGRDAVIHDAALAGASGPARPWPGRVGLRRPGTPPAAAARPR